MALTIAKNAKARGMIDLSIMSSRDVKMVPLSITFDSSYPTGGEDFSFDGINEIMIFLLEGVAGYVFAYDYTNDKILAYTTAGTEVVNGTDLAAALGGPVQGLLLGY
jgi:hypothetical protein